MLSIDAVIELLNDANFQTPLFVNKWRDLYFDMSLHTAGACPAFCNLDNHSRILDGVYIKPTGWLGVAYDFRFNTFLLNRHPRESESTRQWRLSQYKPYTQAPFRQCIDVIRGAIFQDSNYSIEISDKDDNDYVWGNNFEGKNLPQYIASKFTNICEDANGVFVIIPKEPGFATTTSRIEPKIYFIPSIDIIQITNDEIIFNLLDFAWVINNIGYFRFQKNEDGKYIHVDGELGYFAHLLGRQPLVVAGGNWNTKGYFESWLKAAQSFADDFVSNKSAEQLLNKEVAHPFIQMADSDCPDCGGTGELTVPINPNAEQLEYHKIRCSRCKGERTISRNPGEILTAPVEDMEKDLIKITNPDVSINEFHATNNKNIYDGIMRALHLNYIDEAQSGVAKDKDMETRYQFILNISNDLFDRVITSIINDILSLRNVTKANGQVKPSPSNYVIVKPTQFQIKTASDLLLEYTEATKANIPDYLKAKQLEDYVDKQFGGDDVLKKKTCIINDMDILAGTSESDKQIKLLGGAIAPRDWQFNTHLPNILDTIIRQKGNEWFLNAKYDDIKQVVDPIFETISPLQNAEKQESATIRA